MAKLSLEPRSINSANKNEYTIHPGASQASLDGSLKVTNEKAFGAAISAYLSDRPLEIKINFKIGVSVFVFPVGSVTACRVASYAMFYHVGVMSHVKIFLFV